MAIDRSAHPSGTHPDHADHETCPHCGQAAGLERAYDMPDRMMQALLNGLCHQMGVEVYRKSPRATARLYVMGPDAATLDRLNERLRELWPALDAALTQVVRDYVHTHTGFVLAPPPPRP